MDTCFDKPVFSLRGISKQFGGVHALQNVDCDIYAAEVVALVGENGAGKSTLMKIIGGIHQPDSGQINYNGKLVTIPDVRRSIEMGVGFIHQELNVLDNLDIAGNMFLGREPVKGGYVRIVDKAKLYKKAMPYLKKLGLNLPPDTPMNQLSIAQQQIVEIAKALSLNACMMIMDEPTSSLTMAETQLLFEIIRKLRNNGVSIVYISHRLNEIEVCADRVIGLRDGKISGQLQRDEITHDNMVKLMVGRNIQPVSYHNEISRIESRFKVENIQTTTWPEHKISFEVFPGEIFGITGLVGAGRTELARAIFGADSIVAGKIILDNEELQIKSISDAVKSGIYLVPEDRRNSGLIMDMSVKENLTLPDMSSYSSFGLLQKKAEITSAGNQCRRSNIKTADINLASKNLSGGNQQKIVISKWLACLPQVVILDEPTRGIDVGAKSEIYNTLRELTKQGIIVIVISSDMEEVMHICDRVMVMHEGKNSGFVDKSDFSEEYLMNLAVGKTGKPCSIQSEESDDIIASAYLKTNFG